MKTIAVVCLNHTEYSRFIAGKLKEYFCTVKFAPLWDGIQIDDYKYIWANDYRKLNGHQINEVVYCGRYWARTDLRQIELIVKSRMVFAVE